MDYTGSTYFNVTFIDGSTVVTTCTSITNTTFFNPTNVYPLGNVPLNIPIVLYSCMPSTATFTAVYTFINLPPALNGIVTVSTSAVVVSAPSTSTGAIGSYTSIGVLFTDSKSGLTNT
jgi:hypothetical protein